uniref:Uncharacterized protein n=1 Tax=Spongospora subterranea TaxID=70186 RepID=A0A0H5QWR7_9EUKA|eukprot:CRZ06355.1 hypothetical protein [Spongospora subterranea]
MSHISLRSISGPFFHHNSSGSALHPMSNPQILSQKKQLTLERVDLIDDFPHFVFREGKLLRLVEIIHFGGQVMVYTGMENVQHQDQGEIYGQGSLTQLPFTDPR